MPSTNPNTPDLPKKNQSIDHQSRRDQRPRFSPPLDHRALRVVRTKQIIEDLFANRQLRSVSIYFTRRKTIWCIKTNDEVHLLHDWERFAFLRLSASGQKAVFSSGKPMAESVLQDHLDATTKEIELLEPRHIVKINDTPPPGLVMDRENRTIPIERKPLFSLFFAEKVYDSLLAEMDHTKVLQTTRHPRESQHHSLSPEYSTFHSSALQTPGIVLTGNILQQIGPISSVLAHSLNRATTSHSRVSASQTLRTPSTSKPLPFHLLQPERSDG